MCGKASQFISAAGPGYPGGILGGLPYFYFVNLDGVSDISSILCEGILKRLNQVVAIWCIFVYFSFNGLNKLALYFMSFFVDRIRLLKGLQVGKPYR